MWYPLMLDPISDCGLSRRNLRPRETAQGSRRAVARRSAILCDQARSFYVTSRRMRVWRRVCRRVVRHRCAKRRERFKAITYTMYWFSSGCRYGRVDGSRNRYRMRVPSYRSIYVHHILSSRGSRIEGLAPSAGRASSEGPRFVGGHRHVDGVPECAIDGRVPFGKKCRIVCSHQCDVSCLLLPNCQCVPL